MKESLCKTCIYGHCVVGKMIHRVSRVNGDTEDFIAGGLPDIDDYLDEEEQEILSSGFKVNVNEQYLPTTTSICYYPHIPIKASPNFESYVFTDGIVEECNRYESINV